MPDRMRHGRQVLPVELIHHIISFLCQNTEEEDLEGLDPIRTPDLAACALVCHSWNDISRSYMFRTITICEDSWNSRFSFLHFTSPHLCKYTRELRLELNQRCLAPEWFSDCLERFTNLLALDLENWAKEPPLIPLMGIGSLLANIPLKRLHLRKWVSFDDASDILHILSLCSASLEELSLEVFITSARAQPINQVLPALPPGIHLPALRTLALLCEIPDISQATGIGIEIPDLETLTIEVEGHDSWSIAGWNFHHITQLNLTVPCEGAIPDLGPSIRPSHLTIDLSEMESRIPYLPAVAWVEGCIRRLPFPEQLHQLTIKIASSSHTQDAFLYPQRTHYEALHRIFQSLIDHQTLRRIDLDIAVLVQGSADMPPSFSMENEIGTLKEVFAPLFGAGLLGVRLVLERLVYCDRVWETELIMQRSM
ncbi:hypothetical protein PTI98_013473 [Pleurotus ostreatus]|nr:hypothetical protein PTI98_013473 [Pleurotus ostreatus]